MSTIPAHIRAILAGSIRAQSVVPVAPVPDRAPVFEPEQRSRASSSRVACAIEQSEDIECHDSVEVNCDIENYSLSMVD